MAPLKAKLFTEDDRLSSTAEGTFHRMGQDNVIVQVQVIGRIHVSYCTFCPPVSSG